MDPIETIKKEWSVVRAAPWSAISLGVVAFAAAFGFAALLFNAALTSKDSEIGNLNSRIANLNADKEELTKKLTAASGNEATIDSLKKQLESLTTERDDLAKKLGSVPNQQAYNAQAEALSGMAKERDHLRQQADALRGQLSASERVTETQSGSFSDQQRIAFEDALRYRIRTGGIPEHSEIDVYAEAANQTKARAFADMLLAGGFSPARDAVGSPVLKPNYNLGLGITVRGTAEFQKGGAARDAVRQSMSQAGIPFRDDAPVDGDIPRVEIGN